MIIHEISKIKCPRFYRVTILFVIILLNACQSPEESVYQTGKRKHTEDVNVVITSKAARQPFYKEFVNNGTLLASQRARLNFGESGKILKVNVANGQSVKRGTVIACVEDVQQQFTYESACRNVEKCRLSFEESLINQGYILKDSALVPENMMRMALIRSGYQDAINEMKMALYKLRETKVIAPFDGVVADLEAKPNNMTSNYETCCTLIDNSSFEVTFPMLESEMEQLEIGMDVEVVPFAFSRDTIEGRVSEINPKVEENGMVNVKALVKNRRGKLVDGMNVKIMVKKPLGMNLCVPKEAVTLRQEKNVIFVAHNDTAYWRYVDVGETNSTYTVIKSGIEKDEEVVVEGNFNLAHLSPVQVIKSK